VLSPDRQKQSSDRDATGAPAVDLSASLTADLGLLSAAVQDPGGDLRAWLGSLVDDLHGALGSYLGLTLTMVLDGQQIHFTVSEHPGEAGASLCIPLAAVTRSDVESTLVLYAAAPGAFVDLAADLAWALALDPATLVLDEHLVVPTASNAVIGLREQAIVNQAVGVLIDHGHTPQSAHTALRHHADNKSVDMYGSAQRILKRLRRPAPAKEV
jgi:hypothetical protein